MSYPARSGICGLRDSQHRYLVPKAADGRTAGGEQEAAFRRAAVPSPYLQAGVRDLTIDPATTPKDACAYEDDGEE